MLQEIEKLATLFSTMVDNYNSFNGIWKNIELGKQAFAIMVSLPLTVEGEFATPAEKAGLLSQMLDQMEETYTPRFCIEVREYMLTLDPEDEDNIEMLAKLNDYINPEMTMEEYCEKYRVLLKFDPVERTEEWENVIYRVEEECDKALKNEHHGMGFCFAYWAEKRDVLQRYGIEWETPSTMNPGVIFD